MNLSRPLVPGFVMAFSYLTVAALCAAPKPEDAVQAQLPAIWTEASPQARLVAVRIAELDAARQIAERVYGLQISEDSNVRELAELDERLNGEIKQFIKGIATTEGPTYHEDGRVEVVRAVKVQQLVELVREVFPAKGTLYREVERREQPVILDALGNGALPGSAGHKKILAKRAAELDAYRRLAERVLGLHLSGDSRVYNFAVASDRIRASLSTTLKNAEPIRIVYQPDNGCAVTMKLAIGPVIRVINKEIGVSNTQILDSRTTRMVIEETGRAVPPVEAASSNSTPSIITEVEIQKIIDQAMSAE